MAKVNKSEKVPAEMQGRFDEIVKITDEFCRKNLNKEYAQLIRFATAALCRKRPSPLVSGEAKTWACGITHAIGMVNFLSDKSQKPYMQSSELCQKFGVSVSSGQGKSKIVRDALKTSRLDPNWSLPSRLDTNPLAWMITVNGFVVDVRSMPREVQEIAYQKGLIPYIPSDKNN